MPLFSSIGRGAAKPDPIVDIERLLFEYVWSEVLEPSCFDRMLKNRRYQLEVNWSFLDISHRLVSFNIHKRDNTGPSSSPDKRSKVVQRDLCLFRTEFTNSSPIEQTFTFKTERKTTSRCDISIQKGFKIGANVDIRVSVPVGGPQDMGAAQGTEGCRITGGLSGELHVTKTTGQTFEETLTWGVDSQVKVEKGSRTVAELLIREEELTADFKIENVIRAVCDKIPVYVKERKTGKILEIVDIPSENLGEILSVGEQFEKIENTEDVKCETKGTLRAVYGAEQIIRIENFKNEKDAKATSWIKEIQE